MSKILRVPVDRKVDLRGLGGSTVYTGQFQLGVTAAHEDGMAVYESIDGTNFYRLVELSASGMQTTLPDTPYIYVTEKNVKKYDGGTVVGTGANITIEGVAGRIKGFADSSPLGAEDRIQVTGTLTGGIATLNASGIGVDALRTANTYSNVAATGSLSGTSGTVTVVVANGGGITSIVLGNAAGSGYVPGESITIADSLLGNGGAAPITFTVATTNAGVGIVSGTTYEIKIVDTTAGTDASAQIELVELDGTTVTTSGSTLAGLTFTLLNESAMGATATLSQLQGSSKYFGASTLHYYKEA